MNWKYASGAPRAFEEGFSSGALELRRAWPGSKLLVPNSGFADRPWGNGHGLGWQNETTGEFERRVAVKVLNIALMGRGRRSGSTRGPILVA